MTDWGTDDEQALAGMKNLIVVLADNKYGLGRRMAEWAVGPPTLEGSVAGAAIGQQMLGQARLLYPTLEQLPGAAVRPPDEEDRPIHRMSALDEPWETWPQAVATIVLVNTACTVVLEKLAASADGDLATRINRMLDDGRFQGQYTQGRVAELQNRYKRGPELLQEQVDAIFPEVAAWFGPHDQPDLEAMAKNGLITGDAETWRREWLDRVSTALAAGGVETPATRNDDGTWQYEEVPWDRWNGQQRRLEAQPATTT